MRKLFAILLLSIHVFTIGGYRLVLNSFEQKANVAAVQKINSNVYTEEELLTVKIPLNLPYLNSHEDFEKYEGSININGTCYNYVQRKMVNDTLVLQCIPNTEKTKLNKANAEYAKNTSDAQPSSNEKAAGALLKLFFTEYSCKTGFNLSASLAEMHNKYAISNDEIISAPFLSLPIQPPEIV